MSEDKKFTPKGAESFVATDDVNNTEDELDKHEHGLMKEEGTLRSEELRDNKGRKLVMLNEMLSPNYKKAYDSWSDEDRSRSKRENERRGGEAAGTEYYSTEQREALKAVIYGSSPYDSGFREAVERAISLLSPDVLDVDRGKTIATYDQDAAAKRTHERDKAQGEVIGQLFDSSWKDVPSKQSESGEPVSDENKDEKK